MKNLVLLFCLLFIVACQPNKQAGDKNQTAMDADKEILFIGTYTKKEGHVDGKGKGVYVYAMDKKTGELTYVSTSDEIISPSYITVSKDGKHVYAANEFDGGEEGYATLTALKYNPDLKTLSFLNEVSALGQYPCFISMDNSGGFIMAANYVGGSVELHPVLEDGLIGEALSYKRHYGQSENPRQEAAHAHQIVQMPNSNLVFAVDLGANKVYEYELDTLSLTLNEMNAYDVKPAQSGPRHMAFHPQKELVYLLNELSGTIEVMELSAKSRFQNSIQSISTRVEGEERDAASAAIKIHPNGKFLYASNRGELNEVVVFSIDDEGKLTPIQHMSTAGKTPRDFEIDPSGNFLLVANQDSSTLITFKINQSTGMLEKTGFIAEVPSPVCIKFLN
jgi:6-phosphogluconolactonase